MDVTNMSLYLGRTAYQPTKVDKEIIIEIIKENERRKSLKKEKTVVCNIRDTGVSLKGKVVKELMRQTLKNEKVEKSETLGYFITN